MRTWDFVFKAKTAGFGKWQICLDLNTHLVKWETSSDPSWQEVYLLASLLPSLGILCSFLWNRVLQLGSQQGSSGYRELGLKFQTRQLRKAEQIQRITLKEAGDAITIDTVVASVAFYIFEPSTELRENSGRRGHLKGCLGMWECERGRERQTKWQTDRQTEVDVLSWDHGIVQYKGTLRDM